MHISGGSPVSEPPAAYAAGGEFGAIGAGRPIPFGTIPARPFPGTSQVDGSEIISSIDARPATAGT